jgi:hypothetical protein
VLHQDRRHATVPQGSPGVPGGGAQGSQGSRGRGSYAHAVASHGVDAQQVQVYEDADF